MTLSQAEFEAHIVGSSSYVNNEPEQFPSDNVEGLQPVIEVQQQSTIDTTIGSIDFYEPTCLEPDQIPQVISQSLRSLPNDSRLPVQPPERQSSMIKKNVVQKKQAGKYPCPEPDCTKSYTQSHNLKSHRRNKHNSI